MPDTLVKKFSELSVDELYDILRLRGEVFAVEQNCVYLECDGYDKIALHVMLHKNSDLVAYARIIPPETKYPQTSIGRVVVHPDWRGKQLARKLMEVAIQAAQKAFPHAALLVQAQTYLEKFYETLGFLRTKEPYDDHGIMHIDMVMA